MGNCCICKKKDSGKERTSMDLSRRPDPPPIPEPTRIAVLLRALYDYKKQMEDDIAFRKGDILELIDKSNEQWWIALNTKTNEQGYVPMNYVRIEDDTPQSHECYFDIQRRDAERKLLAPGSSPGQFMVRPSAKPNCFALTVRDQDPHRVVGSVKHYLIRIMENNRGFYISPNIQFKTFKELIEHYQRQQDGLCRRLTDPAPRGRVAVPFPAFEVDRRCVLLGMRLGAGCFGEVYQAKFNEVLDVAVKTLKPGTMSTEKFIKEAQIMHKLIHPKIVQLLGVCTKSEPVYIIVELMPNGALLNYLQNHATARDIAFNDQIDMAAQISDGMAYLENQRLVHRDLRAANILVGENNEVKISDFGLTTLLEEEIYTPDENAKFPVRWTAPEAMFHRQFSIKSDVWSFGVLLYEIITYGRQPYPGMTNREVMDLVQSGQCMSNPHNANAGIFCPDALYDDIMKDCWKYDPNKRPTFDYLHETLDNFGTATGPKYDDQPLGQTSTVRILSVSTTPATSRGSSSGRQPQTQAQAQRLPQNTPQNQLLQQQSQHQNALPRRDSQQGAKVNPRKANFEARPSSPPQPAPKPAIAPKPTGFSVNTNGYLRR